MKRVKLPIINNPHALGDTMARISSVAYYKLNVTFLTSSNNREEERVFFNHIPRDTFKAKCSIRERDINRREQNSICQYLVQRAAGELYGCKISFF